MLLCGEREIGVFAAQFPNNVAILSVYFNDLVAVAEGTYQVAVMRIERSSIDMQVV